MVGVEFSGSHDETLYEVKFKANSPTGEIDIQTSQSTKDKWTYNQTASSGAVYYKIFIGNKAPVGKYILTAQLYKKDGMQIIDTKAGPEFYVIFNPWSKDDEDVYNNDFTNKERKHHVIGDEDYNYYGEY